MEDKCTCRDGLKIENLLTSDFLAQSLKVTKGTLDSWRRKFGLPFVRLGGKVFYLEDSFMEWVDRRREQLGGPGPHDE